MTWLTWLKKIIAFRLYVSKSSKIILRRDAKFVAATVESLKQQGISAQELQTLLDRLQIELVLTAHPTEAKRRTILSKMQRITEVLQLLNQNNLLPREMEAHQQALHAEITAFWLTERAPN